MYVLYSWEFYFVRPNCPPISYSAHPAAPRSRSKVWHVLATRTQFTLWKDYGVGLSITQVSGLTEQLKFAPPAAAAANFQTFQITSRASLWYYVTVKVRPVSLFIPLIDYYQQVVMRNHLKSLANVRGVSVCLYILLAIYDRLATRMSTCDTRTPNKTAGRRRCCCCCCCLVAPVHSGSPATWPAEIFIWKKNIGKHTDREKKRIIWCVGLLQVQPSCVTGCPPSPGWIIDMTKLALLLLWLFGVCRLQWHSLSVCVHTSLYILNATNRHGQHAHTKGFLLLYTLCGWYKGSSSMMTIKMMCTYNP